MPENAQISDETLQSLQEAAKGFRTLLRKETDLSAYDISAIAVEPVLTALGWDTKNPKVARRPDAKGTLKLLASGNTALTIRAMGSVDTLPARLPKDLAKAGEWVVLTNGLDWAIFNHHNPDKAFRTASLKTVTTTRDAAPVLGMIEQAAFKKDALAEAWMSEAVDHDVKRVLAAHLDGSDALVSALQENLAAAGVTMSPEAVKGALARIAIAIDEKPAAEIAPEAEPAAAAAQDAPKKAAAAKPAKAKGKAPAAKSSGKASAKSTSAKKTEEPAAPAPAPEVAAQDAAAPEAAEPTVATAETGASDAGAADAGAADSKTSESGGTETANEAVVLPSSPDEMEKPAGTTHVMHRKRNIAFLKYNRKTGQSVVLPGSIITANVGKALTPIHQRAREEAMASGKIVPKGDMLEVVKRVTFDSPRAAATFVAATLVKDMNAWLDGRGRGLVEVGKTAAKEPAEATA